MKTQLLRADLRPEKGKGTARRLRRAGKMPAVIYGRKEDPASLSLSPVDLRRALSTEYGRNVLIKLSVGESEQIAMTKEVQVDPVSRELLHVDFIRVDPEQPVDVPVPFRASGKSKGVLAGGEMNVVFRDIPVRAKPADIPSFVEGDVRELNINEMLRASDLQLPEGVQTLLSPDQTVVAIIAERKKEELEAAVPGAEGEEKPEGEAEGEAAVPVEGKNPEEGE